MCRHMVRINFFYFLHHNIRVIQMFSDSYSTSEKDVNVTLIALMYEVITQHNRIEGNGLPL